MSKERNLESSEKRRALKKPGQKKGKGEYWRRKGGCLTAWKGRHRSEAKRGKGGLNAAWGYIVQRREIAGK